MKIIPRQQIKLSSSSIKDYWKTFLLNDSYSREFENQLKKNYDTFGVKTVNSGRSALLYILKALELKSGDKIALSALNYNVIPKIILKQGFQPVLIDVDPASWLISETKLKKVLNKEKNIKAIIATHLFGNRCNLASLSKLSNDFNIPLIEDSAHSVLDNCNEQKVGTVGRMSLLSFEITKHLNALGGGAIICNNKNDHNKIIELMIKTEKTKQSVVLKKLFKLCLQNVATSTPIYPLIVYPFQRMLSLINKDIESNKDINKEKMIVNRITKLSELQAFFGITAIAKVKKDNIKRKQLVNDYIKNLSGIVKFMKIKGETSSMLYFPILVDDKDKFYKKLLSHGVDSKRNYMTDCSNGNCSDAKYIHDHMICLPVFPKMTKDDVLKICKKVKLALRC